MSSFNTSSSTSSPVVTPTPENSILDQIAGYAALLAPQMMSWAQGAFAQTSQVTSEAVNNFFQASQQMTGLAGNMINQYNNLFAPENAQLVADANSYASPTRMAVDMGMAGATQAQAGNQAIKNSEQNLLSYGIDPSAGRYAALDKAAAVQNAANVAGAENQQRMADINTGQQLRAEAVQVGSLLPSSISNAENTAIQANAGASNASQANANTGANLMSLADKYLQTAMGLKLSPVGQQSNSNSFGSGSRGGGGGGGGSSGRAGGNGGGGGGTNGNGNGGWNGMHTGDPAGKTFGVPGGMSPQGPADETGWGSVGQSIYSPVPGQDPNGGGEIGQFDSSWPGDGTGDVFGGANPAWDQTGQGYTDVFGGQTQYQDTGGIIPPGDGGANGSWANGDFGNNTYDPSANQSQGWSDPSTSTDTNWGGDNGAFSDYGSSGSSDSAPYDYSSDPNGGYAHGGAVQQRFQLEQGGQVAPGMSPSNGAQTDDVRANLNANEFVVPKDVATWKGEEFFHKLIADSRNKRAQMATSLGTGPTMKRVA